MARNTAPYLAQARGLLRLGLPLVGSSLAGFALHLMDTVMLGWYSLTALAAAVLAGAFWFALFIIGAGFGNAALPVVAEASAAGDEVRVRRFTRMAIWVSLIYGLCIFPILWFSGPILTLLQQPPDVVEGAQLYLRIAAFGMFGALVANVLRGFLGALHHTAIQLVFTLVALIIKFFLNWALIFGHLGLPALGIVGAAVSSSLLEWAFALAYGIYAARRLPRFQLFIRFWKPDWLAFGDVLRLGLPIGLTSFAETAMFEGALILMGWMGKIEIAAHGIALQLAATTFMFHVGMSQAATILAGGAVGRRDEEELRRTGLTAHGVSLVFALFVIAAFLLFPSQLISLFISPEEPQRDAVLLLGTSLVYMAALFQLADAGQVTSLALLRGVQDTRVPMWLAAIAYWLIGMPAAWVFGFPLGFGPVGVWIGLTAGLAAAFVLLASRFWLRARFFTRRSVSVPAASA